MKPRDSTPTHAVDLDVGEAVGELVDAAPERRPASAEQRRDVAERDAGLRVVGDLAHEGPQPVAVGGGDRAAHPSPAWRRVAAHGPRYRSHGRLRLPWPRRRPGVTQDARARRRVGVAALFLRGRGGWVSSRSAGAGSTRAAVGRAAAPPRRRTASPSPRRAAATAPRHRAHAAGTGDDDGAQILAAQVVAGRRAAPGERGRPGLQQAEHRRGEEDRRVRTGEHPDEQGDGELAQRHLPEHARRRSAAARSPAARTPASC